MTTLTIKTTYKDTSTEDEKNDVDIAKEEENMTNDALTSNA